jgi:acyl-CoA hydrolase
VGEVAGEVEAECRRLVAAAYECKVLRGNSRRTPVAGLSRPQIVAYLVAHPGFRRQLTEQVAEATEHLDREAVAVTSEEESG